MFYLFILYLSFHWEPFVILNTTTFSFFGQNDFSWYSREIGFQFDFNSVSKMLEFEIWFVRRHLNNEIHHNGLKRVRFCSTNVIQKLKMGKTIIPRSNFMNQTSINWFGLDLSLISLNFWCVLLEWMSFELCLWKVIDGTSIVV